MQWITRERPKIDRIACPWLIQRFIDPEAQFIYVSGMRYFESRNKPEPFLMTSPAPSFRMSMSCAVLTPFCKNTG